MKTIFISKLILLVSFLFTANFSLIPTNSINEPVPFGSTVSTSINSPIEKVREKLIIPSISAAQITPTQTPDLPQSTPQISQVTDDRFLQAMLLFGVITVFIVLLGIWWNGDHTNPR